MAGDPTAAIWPIWIDNSGDGGGTQSVEVDGDSYSVSDPDPIPMSDAYVYEREVTGLDPDTEYEITINSEETVENTLKTLPNEQPDGGTDFVYTSDFHTTRDDGMEEIAGKPGAFDAMADHEPDFVIMGGDYTYLSYQYDHPDFEDEDPRYTEDWLEFWDDYWQPFRDLGVIPPIFAIPGNHELYAPGGVKEGFEWYGQEGPSDPDIGYYQLFFPNSRELGATDENYAEITIGDYIQFIGLDNHSAYPTDQTDWMEDVIDESVPLCFPFHHIALFPGVARSASSEEIQRHHHDEWGPIFSETENIYFTFCGNEHTRKLTQPMTVVESEPDGDAFELDDGRYLTADSDADNSWREFGDGWMQNRTGTPDLGDWFLDRKSEASDRGEQYYTVHTNSDEVTITEHYQDGDEITTDQINQPQIVAEIRNGTIKNAVF